MQQIYNRPICVDWMLQVHVMFCCIEVVHIFVVIVVVAGNFQYRFSAHHFVLSREVINSHRYWYYLDRRMAVKCYVCCGLFI